MWLPRARTSGPLRHAACGLRWPSEPGEIPRAWPALSVRAVPFRYHGAHFRRSGTGSVDWESTSRSAEGTASIGSSPVRESRAVWGAACTVRHTVRRGVNHTRERERERSPATAPGARLSARLRGTGLRSTSLQALAESDPRSRVGVLTRSERGLCGGSARDRNRGGTHSGRASARSR